MKILLVVNPSASGVSARSRVMIQNALSADHDLTVSETSRRGHATRLAQSAASNGYDVVVALGGDGTVNEVTNGLARTNTALGVLPGGSTNVFARTLGLVNEPVEATGQLLKSLARGGIRRVSLGNVNGRFFCFHVGLGFDAAVVEQVEKRGSLKRWLGHPLFVFSAIDTWVRHFDRKRPAFRVDVGPFSSDDALPYVATSSSSAIPGRGVDGYFAIVLNTDPYTYLGSRGLTLAPGNDLDNPLSTVVLTSMTMRTVVGAVSAAVRSRPVAGANGVDARDNLTEIRVVGHRPFPWQVDGDHLGDAEELVFRWEPNVLDLVMP